MENNQIKGFKDGLVSLFINNVNVGVIKEIESLCDTGIYPVETIGWIEHIHEVTGKPIPYVEEVVTRYEDGDEYTVTIRRLDKRFKNIRMIQHSPKTEYVCGRVDNRYTLGLLGTKYDLVSDIPLGSVENVELRDEKSNMVCDYGKCRITDFMLSTDQGLTIEVVSV